MSYESPIKICMDEMHIEFENQICKAVQNVGITVDRDELLRALKYDREQYLKGYADRDKEITRCRDCGACAKGITATGEFERICVILQVRVDEDFFCKHGRRIGVLE